MDELTTTKKHDLSTMREVGQAANTAAARHVFADHYDGKSKNTIRRKLADLALFAEFLQDVGAPASDLAHDPTAWTGITWGLVEAFKKWMVQRSFSIASVNGRLSTVRVFAGLAAKVGCIETQENMLIQAVKGYSHKEAQHVNQQRKDAGIDTRTGAKKADPVSIPSDIAEALKHQPNTPQGCRDALLMCLLLDHGLRVGEAAILTRQNFDMKAGEFKFFRPKVNKEQTHEMTADTRNAAKAYLVHAPKSGIIWRKTTKSGALSGQMSEHSTERALTKRVKVLGELQGLDGLSAHDCRHYWTTYEFKHRTPLERVQDAGGWNSPAMPLQYREAAHIANEGTARIQEEDD